MFKVQVLQADGKWSDWRGWGIWGAAYTFETAHEAERQYRAFHSRNIYRAKIRAVKVES